jgi:hypothetical protein
MFPTPFCHLCIVHYVVSWVRDQRTRSVTDGQSLARLSRFLESRATLILAIRMNRNRASGRGSTGTLWEKHCRARALTTQRGLIIANIFREFLLSRSAVAPCPQN